MANKEASTSAVANARAGSDSYGQNQLPTGEGGSHDHQYTSTSRNLPESPGVRHWQQAALNYSPPFSMLSPNSRPSLARQRDHSACAHSHSPVKDLNVRKTRENLTSIYADVVPPCVHSSALTIAQCLPLPPSPSINQHATTTSVGTFEHNFDTTATTLVPSNASESGLISPPSDRGKMLRHKSVSRRMLSKVKEGITHRSKSATPMHAPDSETSLMRRFSGKRKHQAENRTGVSSFEISRDSIDSQPDEHNLEQAAAGSQRSFTGSSVSTDEIMSTTLTTPPLVQSTGRSPMDKQYPTALLPPSPTPRSPSPEVTPRPPRSLSTVPEQGQKTSCLAVPYVDLEVLVECSSIDVSMAQGIWVAIEATVRSSLVEEPDLSSARLPRHSLNDEAELLPACHRLLGSIPSLRLCFKPMGRSCIEEVVGQKAIRDVKLGQTCSLFLKTHVPKIDTSLSRPTNEVDQDSLFTELESLVGTLETEFLHIEARYRHSMLPRQNVVTLRRICSVKRPDTNSHWSTVGNESSQSAQAAVYSRLTDFLASNYPPAKALKLLDRWTLHNSAAQDHVHQVRQALEARAKGAVATEEAATEPPQAAKPAVVITDIDKDLPLRPPLSLPSNKDTPASAPPPPPSARTLSAPKTTTAVSVSSHDSARQLWQHIRRSSLSAQQLLDLDTEKAAAAGDEHLRALKSRAVANKRSVGAETLRAWRWEGQREGRSGVGDAPWL